MGLAFMVIFPHHFLYRDYQCHCHINVALTDSIVLFPSLGNGLCGILSVSKFLTINPGHLEAADPEEVAGKLSTGSIMRRSQRSVHNAEKT